MAFKMTYNKDSFPFKKNTHADEVLVEGQKDATETVFGEGDKAKIDAINSVANLAGSGTQELLKKNQG